MEINDNEFINSSHENWVKVKDGKRMETEFVFGNYAKENGFNWVGLYVLGRQSIMGILHVESIWSP